MSWNSQMDVHYVNSGVPYSSTGSFVDYFEGLTYEHINFIFADAAYAQESTYPSMNSNFYKFGLSEPGSFSYYDYSPAYVVNDHGPGIDENNTHLENPPIMADEQATALHTQQDGNPSSTSNANPVELQVVWQDNVNPDNMTYEELLELGEAVGTQSRGLSEDLISLLPVSKLKGGFFSRKKSRHERCVICQMEYKRGDRQITLPCKHVYHADCGSRWLSINKACPICYKEVFGHASKQ